MRRYRRAERRATDRGPLGKCRLTPTALTLAAPTLILTFALIPCSGKMYKSEAGGGGEGTVHRSGGTAERDREPPAKTPAEGMLPVNFDRVSAEPVRQRKREASGGPRPAVDRSAETAEGAR